MKSVKERLARAWRIHKPIRVWHQPKCAMIQVWPFRFWVHLHVNPDERVADAAFAIRYSVKIRVLCGEKILYDANLFEGQDDWGLCVRMHLDKKGFPSATRF